MCNVVYALATGPGRSAIAVIRASGDGAGTILEDLCIGGAPAARRASVRRLRSADGELLDEALVLWFPGPASFTGEDLFELHLHGGGAVIAAVSARLSELGAALAAPGEFTRRAFDQGRLSLSQAEAIADLVDAETTAQRRQAMSHLDGALHRRGEGWRGKLIGVLALLESNIDFPDEDIPPEALGAARSALLDVRGDFAAAIEDRRGEAVRAGFRIVLVGPPNAGKSSLFNALVRRDAAIVTRHPGTTRDVLEAELQLGGYKVLLADTAGLRRTDDEIEQEGVRRARAAADDADLRLFLHAADDLEPQIVDAKASPRDLLIWSKADIGPAGCRNFALGDPEVVETSIGDQASIDRLRDILERRVVNGLSGGEPPALVRQRHRNVIASALEHLDRALLAPPGRPELAAEDVRLAARDVARLAGRIDAEAVLDQVFATFCIGK